MWTQEVLFKNQIFVLRSNLQFPVNTQWLEFWGLNEDHCREGDYQSILHFFHFKASGTSSVRPLDLDFLALEMWNSVFELYHEK
ncbi:hypothetical protein M758_2G196600 [Ceratodon purpureus]|nr:hypothetical protein M758_2G196600 [Ceratodon purpureus]